MMTFDLLSTVEYGGCSAKISADALAEALKDLPKITDENLLVDISTHDDAGVYRISPEIALIQTTDFFPPVCSDPADFGRIAAANALSDVYAMGGTALTAMNIVMFPSAKIPLSVLADILKGGQEKITEAGAVLVGGHTIDDYPPKYGLAVSGIVHPDRIITNSATKAGDILILTKPIGTGIIIAAHRIGESDPEYYRRSLESMMLLNKKGAEIMQKYDVKAATDITGFSLIGHALKMAQASRVDIRIDSSKVPLLSGAYEYAELGCIPGACFRNQVFAEKFCSFRNDIDYNLKMVLFDAQTSGGLFMAAKEKDADNIINELHEAGFPLASVVGEVVKEGEGRVIID
jgi:selenide,water dikinase